MSEVYDVYEAEVVELEGRKAVSKIYGGEDRKLLDERQHSDTSKAVYFLRFNPIVKKTYRKAVFIDLEGKESNLLH